MCRVLIFRLILRAWEREGRWCFDFVYFRNSMRLCARLGGCVYMHHVSCSLYYIVWRSHGRKHCQHVIYLLSSSLHFPNGLCSSYLLSSHRVLIDFFHIPHADIFLWCFLGQLKSCIRLKVVSIRHWLLKIITLVITYISHEVNTLEHVAEMYVP